MCTRDLPFHMRGAYSLGTSEKRRNPKMIAKWKTCLGYNRPMKMSLIYVR